MLRLAEEAHQRQQTEALRAATFGAWQVAAAVVGVKGTFGEYAAKLGLPDEPGQEAAPTLVSREEAMASAQRALEHFRKHGHTVRGRGAQTAAKAARIRKRRQASG